MRFLKDRDQALFSSRGTRGRRGRSLNSGSVEDCFLATVDELRKGGAGIRCHVLRHGDKISFIPQARLALRLVQSLGRWLRDTREEQAGEAIHGGEESLLGGVQVSDLLRQPVNAG